jgi:dTDP-4-amino-4,6-dideoxygalactose transaminase
MRIEFSPPDITEADISAVADVLRSGWITTGPRTKQFERELALWCQTSRVACLSSATAALECALHLLGIGEGDEVITSAYTYTASASVICHVGATPVLVDVARGSYEMDYEALAAAVTPRTKAVIPVDIAGVMCDYDVLTARLNEVADRFSPTPGTLQEAFDRVIILTDAAHSFGADYRGRPSGSVADFTAFSFHAVKNLTTTEGGALTWQDRKGLDSEALYRRIMLYSLHGQDKDALAKTKAGSWEYDIVAPLFKCNMTDVFAALGLSQLQRYRQILERRRAIFQLYTTNLASEKVELLSHFTPDGNSSAHLCLVRLLGKSEEARNRFIENMASQGVACNVHYKPLPMLTAYKKMGFDIKDYPNALAQYQNEVTLPLHTRLTDDDIGFIAESFNKAYLNTRSSTH